MKLIEKKPVSDHIQVEAFPAAKEKGDLCVFGSLVGFADYNTAAGAVGTVDIGKMAAVFQAAKPELPAAAVGTDVYVTPAGAFATTASGNKLLGTVVAVTTTTFDIAVTG